MQKVTRVLVMMALLQCVMLAAGATSITISVSGDGITDPAPGYHYLGWFTKSVTIEAFPNTGWRFDHWEGDASGSANPLTLRFSGSKSVTAVFVEEAVSTPETALRDYVLRYDPNYSWNKYHTVNKFGYSAHFIDMTSQQWRTLDEVDRVVWQHYMEVHKPWFASDTAVLLIDGGDNGGTPPTEEDSDIGLLGLITGLTVADVKQIPNQPLYFTDEVDNKRTEDEILAYSLDKAMVTGDYEWIVHSAMVKAAYRAMDTVQANDSTIQKFIVAGGSKRGWTAWLLATLEDPRVDAIVPVVIDILNMEESVPHIWEAYGFWPPAIQDYDDFDIFCRMFTEPLGADGLRIVDPYKYLGHTTGFNVPKMVLCSPGDQFFMPTGSQFYYDDLPGEKWIRYVPNTDHYMDQNPEVLESVAYWCRNIKNGDPNPSYSFSMEPDGSIVLYAPAAQTVKLWQATNPNARDFRREIIGDAYTSTVLTDQGGGLYVGDVPVPPQGFTAFFVEADFGNKEIFTSQVSVKPDILPYEGTACQQ